jgi:hypothetical protein
MQRSPELAPLSREHHVALGAALKLRRAGEDDLPRAVAAFTAFFSGDGERHVALEEELLLGGLPPALRERLLDEHARIRAGARELAGGCGLDAAHALGELLAAHVRFEERELFPWLEDHLEPARLAELGTRLRH